MLALLIRTGLISLIACLYKSGPVLFSRFFFFAKLIGLKRLRKPLPCTLVIPSDRIIIRIFNDLPLCSRKNLEKMIYYRVKTDLLPDLQKMDYNIHLLSADHDKKLITAALLFYEPALLEQSRINALKNNLQPENYVLDVSLFIEYLKKTRIPAGLFIKQDEKYQLLGIKENSRLQYLRLIPRTAAGPDKEIINTMNFYQKQNPQSRIEKVFYMGPDQEYKKLKGYISENLSINIHWYFRPAFSLPLLIPARPEKSFFNKCEKFLPSLFLSLACLLILEIIFLSYYHFQNVFYQKQLGSLKNSMQIVRPLLQQEKYFHDLQQLSILLFKEQSSLSTTLYQVINAVPSGIRFQSLEYNRKKQIILVKGYAPEMDELNDFILECKKNFTSAELLSSEQETWGSKKINRFTAEIGCLK